jgi:hypothetical protein
VESHHWSVRALKPADAHPLEVCGEPVPNPIHSISDIDYRQIHVGAVDE